MPGMSSVTSSSATSNWVIPAAVLIGGSLGVPPYMAVDAFLAATSDTIYLTAASSDLYLEAD